MVLRTCSFHTLQLPPDELDIGVSVLWTKSMALLPGTSAPYIMYFDPSFRCNRMVPKLSKEEWFQRRSTVDGCSGHHWYLLVCWPQRMAIHTSNTPNLERLSLQNYGGFLLCNDELEIEVEQAPPQRPSSAPLPYPLDTPSIFLYNAISWKGSDCGNGPPPHAPARGTAIRGLPGTLPFDTLAVSLSPA